MRRGVHDNRRGAKGFVEKHRKPRLPSPPGPSPALGRGGVKSSDFSRHRDSARFSSLLRLCVSALVVSAVAINAFHASAAEPDSPAPAKLRVITLVDAVSFKMGRIEG